MEKDTISYCEEMGEVFCEAGIPEKAIRFFEEIVRLDPNRNDIKKKIERAFRLRMQNEERRSSAKILQIE